MTALLLTQYHPRHNKQSISNEEEERVKDPHPALRSAKHTSYPSWDHTMADTNDVDLDSIIDRLLEVRGSRPGKQVQLLEAEIRHLCQKAREIFISQPILLELEAPIKASNPTLHRAHACYYRVNVDLCR